MRYSREHKQQTRERIVRRASVKLREKGAHGIGVSDLMKDAGLTHGGFYAHFKSREALLTEAFIHAMDRSTAHWRRLTENASPDEGLKLIVERYLQPAHRDGPGQGCTVPTLGAEIVRESPKTRKAFAARLEAMIDMLSERFPDLPAATARKQAIGLLSTMVGALIMARIAGSGDASDAILAAGRDAALGRVTRRKSRKAPAPQ